MRIGIVGGTGREGKGLAARWTKAGHEVSIGSRDAERAIEKAKELGVRGGANADIVKDADVVLITVPYAAHGETLRGLKDALAGKVVIDITVPLQPPKVTQVHLPPGQSAALEAQEILGPAAKVVAALHHVSSTHLGEVDANIDCDVLVCGDDEAARGTAIELIKDLGLRAFEAGVLRNAIALESLTAVLLFINKKYKVAAGAGIRLTGV